MYSALFKRGLACLCLALIFGITSVAVAAQETHAGPSNAEAAAVQPTPAPQPRPAVQPTSVEPVKPAVVTKSTFAHPFWDKKNVWLFSGVAMSRSLDYSSTLNMQARGREEILLPDDVVNNRPGFVALEAAGTAASISLSYLMHRTGHHKLERWVSIAHISVAGFGAARNYALKSKHP